MGKMGKLKSIIIFFFICILSSSLVVSIGISLPQVNFYFFEPGLSISQKYFIIGGENKPFHVLLDGDLLNYTEILGKTEILAKTDEAKAFIVNLKLPDSLPMGPHTLYITARELLPPSSGMRATASVSTHLTVMVPYVGKHPVTKLSGGSAKLGDLLSFNVEIRNLGTLKINSAKANIRIFDGADEIANLDTSSSSVGPEQTRMLKATWMPPESILPGEYAANVTILMDEIQHNHSMVVRIGEENIVFVKYSETLEAGKINEIPVTVKSMWGEEIKNVDITLDLLTNNDIFLNSIKSPVFTMLPWHEREVMLYFNVPHSWSGKFKGKLTLSFVGKTRTKEFKLDIGEKQEPLTERETNINKGVFRLALIMFLLLLVIINLGVYRYLKSRQEPELNSITLD